MHLPFSHEQFLAVFGAYNAAVWPVALGLWMISAAGLVTLLRRRPASRLLSLVLALNWLWSGIVYHFMFFTAINLVARVFAFLFVVQTALVAWFGLVQGRLTITGGRSPRQIISIVLYIYALLYPALALASGLRWPNLPSFGVPCPTTLLTVAVLLAGESARVRGLSLVPLFWSAVGGSAAFVLGVLPDLALPVSGVLLLLHLIFPQPPGSPS